MLDVYNGDTLMFTCPDGVFSRVEEQVRTLTANFPGNLFCVQLIIFSMSKLGSYLSRH